MAFDDDEDEQTSAGVAVARALAGTEDDLPADDGPDTRAEGQEDAKQQAQKSAPPDTTAQDVANTSSYDEPEETETTSNGPVSDEEPAQAVSAAPMTAPKAPTLQPMSNAPIESAQELANEKADFAKRQAAGAFKPSVGRRIGAALAGAAMGFGHIPGAEGIAEGALNAPLDRAKAAETAKEQGTQSQIDAGNLQNQRTQQQNSQAMQEYGLEERDMRNQGYVNDQNAQAANRQSQAQDRDNAIVQFTPNDPTNPYAGGTGVTAAGKKVQNVAPPDKWVQAWAKTPDGQAASVRMSVDSRRKVADSIFGKGNTSEKQEYVATGKISRAASVRIPSAAESKYQDWKAQFAKDNGRPPNAAEISAFGHVASGGMSKNLSDRIESQKQIALKALEADRQAGTVDNDSYLDQWQQIQNDYEDRIGTATGQDVPHVTIRDNVDPKTMAWHGQAPVTQHPAEAVGQHMQASQPKQQPAQQGGGTITYKGKQLKPGVDKVMVNGKPMTVVGINPQTGKLKVQ